MEKLAKDATTSRMPNLGSEGGDRIAESRHLCVKDLGLRTELSGPSTESRLNRIVTATTSRGPERTPSRSRKGARRKALRLRKRANLRPEKNVDPGDIPTELGGLVNARITLADIAEEPAQIEGGLDQGTAGSDEGTESDASRLEDTVGQVPPETLIKVYQINAARSKSVMHELEGLLVRNGIDVCLIQEPATDGRAVYLLDRRPFRVIANDRIPRSAIVIANPAVGLLTLRHFDSSHFAVAVLSYGDVTLTLISAYFQHSEPTQTYVDELEAILAKVSGAVLICADVNARSSVWHDTVSDVRGDMVVELIGRKDLTVHNRAGFPPTFRNRGSACLDVTLTRNNVRVMDWCVAHDLTSSDHALISFNIMTRVDARVESQETAKKYCKSLSEGRDSKLRCLESPDVDVCTAALAEVLEIACEANMPKRTQARRKLLPPWWNEELERELSTLSRWKVKLRNAKAAFRRRAIRTVYSRRKRMFKNHCFRARRDAWRKFVTDTGNSDPSSNG